MNRVANAPCSWGVIENIEGERYDYVRVLDEIAATGYGGTELGDWGFMPTDPAQLAQELAARDLRLLGSWVNNWLHDAARLPEDIETCVRTAKLLAAVGGPECFIVLGNDPYGDPLRSLHSGRITPEMAMSDAQFESFARGGGGGCASGARRKRPAYRRAPAHRHLGGNAGRDRTAAGADRPGAAGHCLRYRPLALRWRRARGGPAAFRRARLVHNLNERVGQFGVELSLEEELHGKWGYVTYEVDNASRIVSEVERVPAVNGRDVQLTIDLDQQQYAEQNLETMLQKRRLATATNPRDAETDYKTLVFRDYPREVPYKAPAGAVVVQNWETGHIIAMASYPTFDNRWFESDLGGGKFEEIFPAVDENGDPIDPDESILVNRAIQGRYNLVFHVQAVRGLRRAEHRTVDHGRLLRRQRHLQDGLGRGVAMRVGSRPVRLQDATCPNLRPCVYGAVDVETALAVSSDTFFYRIGELIMTENDYQPILQEQVRLFGFGADTGIDLPYEFDGTVPDAELKARYAELGVISEDEGSGYFTGDNVQLAIGQGLLSATPLQLANAYSTIANYGFVMKPEIVKAIYAPGVPDAAEPGFADLSKGRLAEEPNIRGEVVRDIPMTEEVRNEISRGLRRVITGPGTVSDYYHSTTGEKLFRTYPSSAIPVGGKTGTRPGPGQLSLDRLLGVRRLQRRPRAAVHGGCVSREVRVRLPGGRAGGEVHIPAAVRADPSRPGGAVRSARPRLDRSGTPEVHARHLLLPGRVHHRQPHRVIPA